MYKKLLLQSDLTPSQAEILNYLYQNKEAKASLIANKIKRSRAIVYKETEELAEIGMIEKIDKPNQVSIFRAAHPFALKKIFEKKEKELKKDKELLESYLPDMISSYNLMSNKPGVRYYEGEEGIWKILNDTLKSKTEILTIADVEAVDKYLKEINKKYVEKRNKKKIKKRLLALDSEYARDHFADKGELTDLKLIDLEISPFSTSLQIYDKKIAYITMTKESLTGTLIEDENIYSMHKALFELLWRKS
jgi:HTH-type transcriptional regulator, sugar sensing transcriptional regulator